MSKPEVKKPTFSPGLAGIYAGETTISTVGEKGVGLTYRGTTDRWAVGVHVVSIQLFRARAGYQITDLSAKCIFEEVAYLLLYGTLPSAPASLVCCCLQHR